MRRVTIGGIKSAAQTDVTDNYCSFSFVSLVTCNNATIARRHADTLQSTRHSRSLCTMASSYDNIYLVYIYTRICCVLRVSVTHY